MATLDEIVGGIERPRRSITLCLDRAARERLGEALAALREARSLADDDSLAESEPVAEARAAVEAAEAACDEAATEFTFEAASSGDWRRLVDRHPPSEDDRSSGRDRSADFDPEAIALCLIDPAAATVESARRLADTLSEGDWTALVNCCIAVNRQGSIVGKSRAASAATKVSATN